MGPDYSIPDLNPPQKYFAGASDELRDASLQPWWQALGDATLSDFVSIGLAQNLDVRTALERMVAAEESTRLFGASRQLDGDASLDARQRDTTGSSRPDTVLGATAVTNFDLFGEFRRGREQSLAELDAARFGAGAVKLAYLSDIVNSYLLVRYFQSAAGITQETIASRKITLKAARQRLEVQAGSQLEVAQAQSLLSTAEASLPILIAQEKVNVFRIATLLNVPAEVAFLKMSAATGGMPVPPKDRAVGLPADLLRNRPDVQAAERSLAAATAAAGVSEAQLYPSLRISGNVSIGDADNWSFGPTLSLPIFDQTRRRAARDIALSNVRQAELAYRKAFITAVEDVQIAMTLTQAREQQVIASVQAASSAERVLNLARRRYVAGVIAIDDVLDAERTRLSASLDLAQARSEYAQGWVRQQVSVGKGWAHDPRATQFLASN